MLDFNGIDRFRMEFFLEFPGEKLEEYENTYDFNAACG